MDKNDQHQTASNQNCSTVINRRSRFPRAQPNITVSSGIARIRRLSGHFSSINSTNIDEENNNAGNNENVQLSSPYQFINSPVSKQTKYVKLKKR
jgi:hypothetical protein